MKNVRIRNSFNPYETGEADTPEFLDKLKDGRIYFVKTDLGKLYAVEDSMTRAELMQEQTRRMEYSKYAVKQLVAGVEPSPFDEWANPSPNP